MNAVQNINPDWFEASIAAPAARHKPTVGLTPPSLEPGNDSDLANELKIAHVIQQSLLPKDFPHLPGLGLAAFCQSARQVGGDFYDVLPLDGDHVLLVIADVMGKGVPAALFAASLRMLLRSCARRISGPGELLERINRQMFNELSSVDMFITVQVVLLDTRWRRLQIASAGHCPLLLASPLGKCLTMAPNGVPLGIDPFEHYPQQSAPLFPGACALLYTDGLIQVCDPEGHPFGQEALQDWLARNNASRANATGLKEALLAELNYFQADTSSQDDVTFLLVAAENPVRQAAPDAWSTQE